MGAQRLQVAGEVPAARLAVVSFLARVFCFGIPCRYGCRSMHAPRRPPSPIQHTHWRCLGSLAGCRGRESERVYGASPRGWQRAVQCMRANGSAFPFKITPMLHHCTHTSPPFTLCSLCSPKTQSVPMSPVHLSV